MSCGSLGFNTTCNAGCEIKGAASYLPGGCLFGSHPIEHMCINEDAGSSS